MRWFIGLLLLVNVWVYFQQDNALSIYKQFAEFSGLVSDAKHEGLPTIWLLSEKDMMQQREAQIRENINTDAGLETAVDSGVEDELTELMNCWLIGVDPAQIGQDIQAQQEILTTLRQRLMSLEITVRLHKVDGSSRSETTPLEGAIWLVVTEKQAEKLSASLWNHLKENWPEVTRKKTRCESIAPQSKLH